MNEFSMLFVLLAMKAVIFLGAAGWAGTMLWLDIRRWWRERKKRCDKS